jgi:D-sedoheptulose 7-phosphate isomerase
LKDQVEQELRELAATATETQAEAGAILEAVELIVRTIRQSGTIYWCGNGGSAAEALHLSTELMGRLRFDRPGIRSVCLSTDPVLITAIGNDYGFDAIFERQVATLVGPNDCLVVMSTSGNSANVGRAAKKARSLGGSVIAFTGKSTGALGDLADLTLRSHSEDTQRIQELHLAMGHIICGFVESALWGDDVQDV